MENNYDGSNEGTYTCLVALLQLNQTVDEVSRTWDYVAEHADNPCYAHTDHRLVT